MLFKELYGHDEIVSNITIHNNEFEYVLTSFGHKNK